MIQGIVDFAIRQRVVVLAAAAILVALGVYSFEQLPIEAYPDVADTWVQVITQWPGHASEEVERQITLPTERVMNGVPRQTVVRSTSIAGLSVVSIVFQDGTDSYFARQQVVERLSQIELPAGAVQELGPLASPVGEIMRYRVVNCAETQVPQCGPEDLRVPPRSLSELKDLEEWVVEREILGTDGVADVVSFGGTVKQYQVLVDPARLAARGLSLADVETALARANGNAGGGVVTLGPASLNVRGIGLLGPREIGDVAVATRDGTPIRIRDVGRVETGYQPRLGRVSVGDDTDVVAATVLLRKGDQAQFVLERLHARVRDINARILPRGVKISPYHDRTVLMGLTTHTVMHNLLEGITLVTLVLFLFLGNARAALIVAVAIPLSLLFAFIGMNGAKIPANLLSIGAIDFGMIVDGSIVMIENVIRQIGERRERGESYDLKWLVRHAASEVARPIVFAVGIIVTSYMPIFTLERVEGRLFRPMAFTVAFSLAGALICAITLVPVLSTYFFHGEVKEWHNPFLEWVKRLYLPALEKLLPKAKWVLVFAGLLLASDLVMASRIGSEFLPHLNEGALWVRATMPANISLAEAESIVDGVHEPGRPERKGLREILGEFPEVALMTAQIGRPDDGTDPIGFYNAEFLLLLRDRSEWRPAFHGNRERLEEAMSDALSVLPGVSFGFSQPISDNVEEAVSGVKGQLAVKIIGDDLNALDDLATQIARAVGTVPGVEDLGVLRELGQSNLHIEIDRERAERNGLTVADVEDVIEVGLGGRVVSQIVEGERRHDLVVRYLAGSRETLEQIRRIPVPIGDGRTVPLVDVARVSIEGGASRIFRERNRRYIAVKFSVRGRDLGSTVADAQRAVARAVRTPEGYEVVWAGEFESAQRAGKRLAIVIPITLLLIAIWLSAMFRRLREAAIILTNVILTSPFGGLLALLVTGTNFSVSSGVGFLALFGVAVQTNVILVAYINEKRSEGLRLDEAIRTSASLRLRPMMMTALVDTLGLVPAALSHGIGSDSQKPLAIVVVGGVISSLALSIFTLPLLYRAFPPKLLREPTPPPPAESLRIAGVVALLLGVGLGTLGAATARADAGATDAPAAPASDSSSGNASILFQPYPSTGPTEDEIFQRWLANSREVEAMRSAVGAARFDVVGARLWPNWAISLGTSGVLTGTPPDGRVNWGPQLSVPIPVGQVRGRERAAEAALRTTEVDVLLALFLRADELHRAMIDRAFADARVLISERRIEELARVKRIVEARTRAGANSPYDALRVGAAEATYVAALAHARIERQRAEGRILALVADPAFRSAEITIGGLTRFRGPEDEAALVTLGLERRPDLELARRGALAQDALRERWRIENRPMPNFYVGAYMTYGQPSVSLLGGVQVALPTFDRNQGLIGRARTEAEGQRAFAEALEARIRFEVETAYRARLACREALASYRTQGLGTRTDMLRRAEVAFESGVFSIAELMDAYEALWNARDQELDLVRELADSEADLERAAALIAFGADE